jgi:4-hydroxy-tetrahydrodipicolinate synthase
VIPAVLLPFFDDLSIDEPSFRAHLRDVASVPGISAITVNAHSTEAASCTFEEQVRVLAITKDEVGAKLPIVNGIYTDSSMEAQRLAKMAHDGGADALLVFPSGIYTFGQRPEMAIEHFKRIADVTDLPLIAFQYNPAGGQGYPLPTLLRMIEAVPTIAAIKDWCGNAQLADRQIRALQTRQPPCECAEHPQRLVVQFFGAGLQWPVVGQRLGHRRLAITTLSSRAKQRLGLAQQIHNRIYHTAEVFYTDPFVDMHNRMKEALVLLGKLPRAVVRPPLMKIQPDEIERIRQALIAAGLLKGLRRFIF